MSVIPTAAFATYAGQDGCDYLMMNAFEAGNVAMNGMYNALNLRAPRRQQRFGVQARGASGSCRPPRGGNRDTACLPRSTDGPALRKRSNVSSPPIRRRVPHANVGRTDTLCGTSDPLP